MHFLCSSLLLSISLLEALFLSFLYNDGGKFCQHLEALYLKLSRFGYLLLQLDETSFAYRYKGFLSLTTPNSRVYKCSYLLYLILKLLYLLKLYIKQFLGAIITKPSARVSHFLYPFSRFCHQYLFRIYAYQNLIRYPLRVPNYEIHIRVLHLFLPIFI